jgi:microcystin-dependent protein
MDPLLASIIMFGGNFAPRSWAFCEGQLLAISQNNALFSILGTTYGGDGRTTFALPDLRGRVAIHPGTGPGLGTYHLGQKGGAPSEVITTNQMPAHTHVITAQVGVSTGNGTTDEPDTNVLAGTSGNTYAAVGSANGHLGGVSATASQAGASQPINLMQPYLAINFIIALQGIFPSRN